MTATTMRVPTCVLLTMALAACGGASSAPLAPASEFTLVQAADSVPLPFGKVVRIGELFLQLTGVEDSRCPIGVQCVWAGDGVVTLVANPSCWPQGCRVAPLTLTLHTTLEPRAGTVWSHRVQLLGLRPEPVASAATEQGRYVAWVRVSR